MAEQTQTKHHRPWLPVIIVLAVIVVAGGAGALLSWSNSRSDSKKSSAIDLVRDVQSKVATNRADPVAAQTAIDEALKRSDLSNQDRYYLYFQKGAFAH